MSGAARPAIPASIATEKTMSFRLALVVLVSTFAAVSAAEAGPLDVAAAGAVAVNSQLSLAAAPPSAFLSSPQLLAAPAALAAPAPIVRAAPAAISPENSHR
jgi:hypothetical protein